MERNTRFLEPADPVQSLVYDAQKPAHLNGRPIKFNVAPILRSRRDVSGVTFLSSRAFLFLRKWIALK